MAKLTRTQKFAELRESLANDKESSLATKDLSSYQNKLNSLTEQLSPFNSPERVEVKTSFGTAHKFDVYHFTYKGHQYIKFEGGQQDEFAIVHDPDCIVCK